MKQLLNVFGTTKRVISQIFEISQSKGENTVVVVA